MKNAYDVRVGLIQKKNNLKKYAAGAVATVANAGGLAGSAIAAQPTNPGCFGRDRAVIIKTVFIEPGGQPGASEWGHIAADRAGTNGDQNRAYKASVDCGQYSG